jgi:hypothetical protein
MVSETSACFYFQLHVDSFFSSFCYDDEMISLLARLFSELEMMDGPFNASLQTFLLTAVDLHCL